MVSGTREANVLYGFKQREANVYVCMALKQNPQGDEVETEANVYSFKRQEASVYGSDAVSERERG